MLHCCIFGGHEGQLGREKKCYFTVFGACELRRPTLARQMITAAQTQRGELPANKAVFITLFGATSIICPTLAEEFIDLREAAHSGRLNLNRWDSYMVELERWQSSSILSLTLFGAFSESALPSENDEVEGLALQRHLGTISEDSGRILETGIGQTGAPRRAVIQQAISAAKSD